MSEIHDPRLHELLVRAELEDMALLHRELSAYLEFWRIAGQPDGPEVDDAEGAPARRAA